MVFLSQSGTLKSRNGSEWRAYCNLNDIGQFSSLIMTHHIHPEFELCRNLTSRAKTHVSLVKIS